MDTPKTHQRPLKHAPRSPLFESSDKSQKYQKVLDITKKFQKHIKTTQKDPKVPYSTQKYTKVPKSTQRYPKISKKYPKLDGVGPVDNNPPPISFATLSKKEEEKIL